MRGLIPLCVLLVLACLPAAAQDSGETAEVEVAPAPPRRLTAPKLDLRFGGRIQSDIRFRVQEKCMCTWYDPYKLPLGVSRNENIAKFTLDASVSRFRGMLDVDLVFTGVPEQPEGLDALSRYETIQPFRIEAHSAYIHARDIVARGLDLRIGQQKVQWGVADQFNPTNNLNADDLEDPLLFGEQQGNLMVKLDYTPHPLWTFSGVVVPIFKPALLPPSAGLGLAAVDRLPFTDPDFRNLIHTQNQMSRELLGYPVVVDAAIPELPETSFGNMQFAFRIGGTLGQQDLAISYYRGFDDFPQPTMNVNNMTAAPSCEDDPEPPATRDGEPGEDEECIDGLMATETTLGYPKIQVLGFNWAGEIPGVGIGYRLELGVYFPERQTLSIWSPELPALAEMFGVSPGEYDYDLDGVPGGEPPEVVSGRAFAKWSLGLDYTFGKHVYLNTQWVHGLVDEFGAGDWMYSEGRAVRSASVVGLDQMDDNDLPTLLNCFNDGNGERCAAEITRPRLADYLVLGIDIRFARNRALLRLFTLWDLSGYTQTSWDDDAGETVDEHFHLFTPEGFSAVIFPEFQYNFGHGFELHVGALVQLGKNYTKFGDPAAGGSQVFVRARYSF